VLNLPASVNQPDQLYRAERRLVEVDRAVGTFNDEVRCDREMCLGNGLRPHHRDSFVNRNERLFRGSNRDVE